MTKKLRAIILSLMLAFSLSLIKACQKAKEQVGEVKEEVTETKTKIKENATEIAREIKDEAAEPFNQAKEKAAGTAEEIKEEAVETVREITITGDKENAAKTTREIKEEAMENVIEVTITGDKENVAGTAEDTEEEMMKEIENEKEQPEETGTVPPAPTLIAEPDYSVTGSTVWVTLEWYPVYHGNPVKYFLRLYCDSRSVYRVGWISGTKWTREIPSSCNYSWKVMARDDVGHQVSAWSTTDSFMVIR